MDTVVSIWGVMGHSIVRSCAAQLRLHACHSGIEMNVLCEECVPGHARSRSRVLHGPMRAPCFSASEGPCSWPTSEFMSACPALRHATRAWWSTDERSALQQAPPLPQPGSALLAPLLG